AAFCRARKRRSVRRRMVRGSKQAPPKMDAIGMAQCVVATKRVEDILTKRRDWRGVHEPRESEPARYRRGQSRKAARDTGSKIRPRERSEASAHRQCDET